jgi:hypothetical protein
MDALRQRAAAPTAVARAPRPRAAAPPRPPQDLAAAARAVGAEVSSGPDFVEISFPTPAGSAHPSSPPAAHASPPSGAAPASVARTAAPGSPSSAPAHAAANAPRALGGGAVLARATGGGSGGDLSLTDNVVEAVLRAMREENEHLGIIDGIDPLF